MTISEKLRLIQKISGLSQEKLAQKLEVSFVALNAWIHGRVEPRAKAQKKIDELYAEYTGQKIIPAEELEAKKQILLTKSSQNKNILQKILENKNLNERFTLSLTYNTNSIEGSTLTESETADIIFRSIALADKSLQEQLEAKNHQTAWQYLLKYLSQSKSPLDENIILKLHSILMNGIREDAGLYRNHGVRILGANVPTANYVKIPFLMNSLVEELENPVQDTVEHIAKIHAQFEKIHPFSDGNGRIGRLLIHAMALKNNLPPAVIFQENRRFYYAYLQKAQQRGDTSLLEDFLCDAFLEGFDFLRDEK